MQIVAHTMEYIGEIFDYNLNVANYIADDFKEYKRVYENVFYYENSIRSTPC